MQGPGQRGEGAVKGKHARSVFVGWRFGSGWEGVPGRGRQRRELGGRECRAGGRVRWGWTSGLGGVGVGAGQARTERFRGLAVTNPRF